MTTPTSAQDGAPTDTDPSRRARIAELGEQIRGWAERQAVHAGAPKRTDPRPIT